MKVRIYVEGGGDHNKDLQTRCRRGFSEFFRKGGLEGRMPRVVVCGGRRQAYDSFRTSQDNAGTDDLPIRLVDSEAPVSQTDLWEHVRLRVGDGWQRPDDVSQDQIQLMVQAMEAWFHADKEELQKYFGHGFRLAALRPRQDIDNIPKADLFSGMQLATRDCLKKGSTPKGSIHSRYSR